MEKEINLKDTININKAIVLVLPTDSVIRINDIELKPELNDDLTQTYILSMPTAEDFLILDKLIACGNFTIECPGTDNPLDPTSRFRYHWSKLTYSIKAYINQWRSILDPHEIKETENFLSAKLTSVRVTTGNMSIQIKDRDSLIIDLKNIKKEEAYGYKK